MNNTPLCGYRDDSRLWDQADTAHEMHRARAVEDAADMLLADCLTVEGADLINRKYDLFDGMFLPKLMSAIANWKGSLGSSSEQMRALHNLLADELQKIAERQVK